MTQYKSLRHASSKTYKVPNCYFLSHLHEVLVPQYDGFRRIALGIAEDPAVYVLVSTNERRKSIAAHLKCLGRKYATSLPNAGRRAQSGHTCAQQHSGCQLRLFIGRIQPNIVSNNSL
jgi:hypothetical protein